MLIKIWILCLMQKYLTVNDTHSINRIFCAIQRGMNPGGLRSFKNREKSDIQIPLSPPFLYVVSLPGNKLVKVGDFVYTPEVQEDGNSQGCSLPEMFKDMQLTQWASDCKTDSSRHKAAV